MKINSKYEKKLLHYTGKAIADFNMIQKGDRIMACLSGGKDSYSMTNLLRLLRLRTHNKFELFAFILNQSQPDWDDAPIRAWLQSKSIPCEIVKQDIYGIVKQKIPADQTGCGLCSRLRRGIIYRYAKEHGFNKIALGHHRDDLIETLLISIFYRGEINSMPPKLLTDDKKHIVIRPMVYCQEKDIAAYAKEQQFTVVSCESCNFQFDTARQKVKVLIQKLARENPKIPSCMLHSLTAVRKSQLMDKNLWDFKHLEQDMVDVSD